MPRTRKSSKTDLKKTRKRKGGADKMAEFEFEVEFIRGPSVEEHKEKIVKWYNGARDTLEETILKNVKISHVRDNIFKGTFEPGPEANAKSLKDELDIFVDNDEDGNHPIKIGKENYLVAGKVTKYPQLTPRPDFFESTPKMMKKSTK
jgi:hypothetical protein